MKIIIVGKILTNNQLILFKDMYKLYKDILNGKIKFNFYEKKLLDIIEEYDYLIDYKKDMVKRYEN